ncbi:hypothetical protein NGM37_60410, partial [Streptomyces sp. TRM76130]|nr:hypothetical protein [Streptomyces sp. TRM76130]
AFPLPVPVDTARWESTGATDWTTLYAGPGIAQHPRVQCEVAVFGSVGAAVRLLVDGVPVAAEQTVTDASTRYATFTGSTAAAFGDPVTFEIQARVAAAGDTVACVPRALYGIQS